MSEEIQDWWAIAERNRELAAEVEQLRAENQQSLAALEGHKALTGALTNTIDQLRKEKAEAETKILYWKVRYNELQRQTYPSPLGG